MPAKPTLAKKKVPLVGGAPLALFFSSLRPAAWHQLLGQQSATAMRSELNCLTNLTIVLGGIFGIMLLD